MLFSVTDIKYKRKIIAQIQLTVLQSLQNQTLKQKHKIFNIRPHYWKERSPDTISYITIVPILKFVLFLFFTYMQSPSTRYGERSDWWTISLSTVVWCFLYARSAFISTQNNALLLTPSPAPTHHYCRSQIPYHSSPPRRHCPGMWHVPYCLSILKYFSI